MANLSTYTDLAQALKDYTGRGAETTWVGNLPLFIYRAHVVAMRELRIPLLQGTADLVINGETVAYPADFRAVARLFIDSDWDNVVNPTSLEGRVRYAVSNPTGRPRVFSIEGTNFAFGPIPDATYTGKLLYYKTLTGLVSGTDTNALLQKHPFIYLYGALAEAARFDKSDEDIQTFEAMFGAEVNAVQLADQLDGMGGGTLMPVIGGVAV